MARYKKFSYEHARFIPIHFHKQILPGTLHKTEIRLFLQTCYMDRMAK